jgi:hypothetical protein
MPPLRGWLRRDSLGDYQPTCDENHKRLARAGDILTFVPPENSPTSADIAVRLRKANWSREAPSSHQQILSALFAGAASAPVFLTALSANSIIECLPIRY